jgi:signal transduction histidine kinase
MASILDIILLVSIAAHVLVMLYLQFNRIPTRLRPTWLQIAWLGSLLSLAVLYLPESVTLPALLTREFLSVLALALMLVLYGQYMLRDALNRRVRFWLPIGILWPVAMLAAALTSSDLRVGQTDWLLTAFSGAYLPGMVTLVGLGIVTALLLALSFYGFYVATLPEVANRALFWVLNTAMIAIGVLLSISGTNTFHGLGAILVLAALIGAVYAHLSHGIVDIRSGMRGAVRTAVLIALTAAVIFGALQIADTLPMEVAGYTLALLLVAVLAGTLYVVLRQLVGLVVRRLFLHRTSPTRAARQYSQQVSKVVELSELVRVATETINQVMGVRRSGMILVNDTSINPQRVEVIVMKEAGGVSDVKGNLNRYGPVYDWLAVKKLPLLQFDLAYGPQFRTLDTEEKHFFQSLQMSAYAPIVMENALVGILMCGPKLNDAQFTTSDLELLATMADQTGVALRNSRAMADLKHLNATMKALNEELEEANQQYGKLDSVKTDFITIASHELRTPLAQIRGYTDILDALNEQGMLDQDQIGSMVSNLRKATERTEELLSAMLDMSQLDVNAMDLRFAQAAPEGIVRMAIEPLTEHIKQRKLTVSARGLRAMPPIHCDMQRLVQAFRNIISNAIKFTPDGGRIDITSSFQPDDNGGHILVSISDTGVGIDKENLELIFEKFYRAYDPSLHSTGSYKFMGAGPGLGLTIARGVIEGHGGKVWAESSGHNMETGPGSTFYVMLPVNPPEDARRVAIEDTNHRNPLPVPHTAS